jgi:hypothetical protein
MAHLSVAEFTEAVTVLADRIGVARLRDRLAQHGAFKSRQGLNSAAAIAERLYRLTGGLRLQVAATYVFSSLWSEMVNEKLGEEGTTQLDTPAGPGTAGLGAHDTVAPGKEEDLDRALVAYRDAVAAATGPEVARLDMLMKAVPAVAERLRAAPASTAAPEA